ncbi:hypothetical protein ACW73L_08065 [Methylolobus aquaticus]
MKWETTLALGAAALLGAQHPALAESNPNDNQIYVPVAQCRVLDTRQSAGGNLVANVAQNFYAYGDAAAISAQGGNPAGCADPKAPDGPEPAAMAVNITAVGNQASGSGNIRAAIAGVIPSNALVNFKQGTNLSNAAIVPLCRGALCPANKQLSLMSALANVPAVVDVTGYFYPKDTNLVTVAKDGGDYVSPSDAIAYLKALVVAADPAAPSAANPWIVQIDPGVYNLGASPLVLDVPYVTVRGAGQAATILEGLGASASGVVQMPVDAVTLSQLSVRVSGAGSRRAIRVSAPGAPGLPPALLSHVSASAVGVSFSVGVTVLPGAQLKMVKGAVSAESPGVVSDAIEVNEGATIELEGTTVKAPSGWALELTGLGGTAATAVARNAQFIGGPIGVALLNGNLQADACLLEATAVGGRALHATQDAPSTATIRQSTVSGPVALNTFPAPSSTTRIAASKVAGTVTPGTASVTCVASYNGNYVGLGSNCR